MEDENVALVRALAGQPLRRVVTRQTPEVLYVVNPRHLEEVLDGRSRAIGFPRRDCFAWNDGEFERLAKAYASNGSTGQDAWRGMSPFEGRPLTRAGQV